MDAQTRLPWLQVLWIRILCGHYRTKKLNDYIHKAHQAKLYNVVLDLFTSEFIDRPDVQRYYHENMPYKWTLRHKLGSLDLGSCTLTQALRRTQQNMPESTVLRVDDIIHSIFIKTIAEGKTQ